MRELGFSTTMTAKTIEASPRRAEPSEEASVGRRARAPIIPNTTGIIRTSVRLASA